MPCALMKMPILLFLSLLFFTSTAALAKDDPLLGFWETEEKDAVIQFYKCESSFCGRFYWLQDDSLENPSLDDRNTNPEKKKRPLCGMTFLGGFSKGEGGQYGSGWIYSPRHGSMFSAKLTLKDSETLELHGFIFLPILGESQTWKHVDRVKPCLLLVKNDS